VKELGNENGRLKWPLVDAELNKAIPCEMATQEVTRAVSWHTGGDGSETAGNQSPPYPIPRRVVLPNCP